MIPKVNYIVNGSGERLYVQLSVKDWDKLMSEHQRLVSTAKFRDGLQSAFQESEKIERGEKTAVTLDEFLDEL
ncbi:MAG: hypothetical protein KA746_14045 [Pyrinomonadaceae bacterium]|nr:hypothetical protein [Pyrinomonadaceae bacterium]MBP6211815.1 hypothetical protein [Pyrinomonadaceae bacterium]